MEKDNLNIIEGIQTPCSACKDTEEKACEYCPYWQFAQLAYFKMKVDPMNAVGNILRQETIEPKKKTSFFSFLNF